MNWINWATFCIQPKCRGFGNDKVYMPDTGNNIVFDDLVISEWAH